MAKGRKRVIAGWGVIGLGIAVTGAMVASRWYFVRADAGARWSIWFRKGVVELHRSTFDSPSALGATRIDPIEPPELTWLLSDYWDMKSTFNIGVISLQQWDTPFGPVWDFEIELWPAALVLLTLGGTISLSGRRAKRRARLGHCPACGYDLKGLAAGAACPECGKGK